MNERNDYLLSIENELRTYGFDSDFIGFKGIEAVRIKKEAEIFQKRGWQEYILFLAAFLKELDKTGVKYTHSSKSAMDSYLLAKMVDPDFFDEHKVHNDNSLSYLENDALRLALNVVTIRDNFKSEFEAIDKALKSALDKYPLKMKEILRENSCDKMSELTILSHDAIPQEHIEIVQNETKESSDYEAEVLRKYLIITIDAKNSI